MALPASGTLTMAQINTEFGRGNNLNSYRGTTYYTSSGGPFTFPSGAISFSNFYGTQVNSPLFSFTIPGNQDQANLRTLALNAGWNGSSPVQATSNNWIYSSTTAAAALTIDGSWPGGVTFINNYYVAGMGGNGGAGNNGVGLAGGTALAVSTPVTIYNYSYIAGGGGGGGGGAISGGPNQYQYAGGGGGGAGGTGLGTSIGGAGGAGLGYTPLPNGAPGGNNYANSGGAGGGGGGSAGGFTGGTGGSGGGWGAAGSTGGLNSTGGGAPGAGGAAGNCTSGNGFITWAVTGNRLGPLG
jgi:hypothetical protein